MNATIRTLCVVVGWIFLCVTWAGAQVPAPDVQAVNGQLSDVVLAKGCFSCYSTVPQPTTDRLRAAGAGPGALPGTMQYVEVDTLVVVYPNYQRDFTGGRVRVSLSDADIETLKGEVAQAKSFLWRSSNCKCLIKADWMVIDRVLTPAQLWNMSGAGGYWLQYWSIGGGSVEQDLRDAGVVNGQYSVVIVLYAFENSDGATAAVAGGTYGVDIGFLGDTSYIAMPLAWGLDCDAVISHEYLHALDSIYTASGNPLGNDMGHADHPESFPYAADSSRQFSFLLANVLDPNSWLALDPRWVRLATAPDADSDGLPDSGDLPITEESFGSSPTDRDTDHDGLDDLKELTATYYASSDPRNRDTDGDGLPDGNDVYPLFWCNDQVARHVPQIDGSIKQGEYTQVARLVTSPASDLSVTAYAAWSEDMLYLAADVTDNKVQTPYQDPYWQFDDNFEVDIDGCRDGWLTGDQRNYRFYAVPVGAGGRPYVFGEFGSLQAGQLTWRSLDVSTIVARYALRTGGYRIEMAIPTSLLHAANTRLPDVIAASGSSVRLTFSVRDFDAYADWPQFNVFNGQDKDTPSFVELHFTD